MQPKLIWSRNILPDPSNTSFCSVVNLLKASLEGTNNVISSEESKGSFSSSEGANSSSISSPISATSMSLRNWENSFCPRWPNTLERWKPSFWIVERAIEFHSHAIYNWYVLFRLSTYFLVDGFKGFSTVCIMPPQTSVSKDVSRAHCAVTICPRSPNSLCEWYIIFWW